MSTNLPILNYDFALNQLGGNEALLSKMLGKFVTEFARVPAEVSNSLGNNDINSAKIKVHTVKGISGNLGLQALFDCATRFETELRAGHWNQSTLLEFTRITSESCIEIQQIDQKEVLLHENSGASLTPETNKTELIRRLKRNEFIDDDTLFDMVSSLQLSESSCRNLISLIEDLQYPEAIAIIEKSC
jgi:HPt (histidine-containing phosphotransfer) domain-containing protein